MDFRAIWRRLWTRDTERAAGPSPSTPPRLEPRRVEEWEAHIRAAGISREWAARLAPSLAQSERELGRGSSPALIRGAAVAMALQAETRAQLDRSLRDVHEVERLLGAFTGELEKLDEVLEVLSAYAQRMRTQKPLGASRRVLH